MRLKWKIGLGIVTVTIAMTVVNVLVISSMLMPWFRGLDDRAASQNGSRAMEFLDGETESLRSVTRDWAQWDETYEFAKTLDETYRDNNLGEEDFETLDIDAFVLTDESGTVTFAESASPDVSKLFSVGQTLPAGTFTPIQSEDGRSASVEGIARSPLGPILVSIAPILNSQRHGPQRGYLVFARSLTERVEARIRGKGHLDAELVPFSGGTTGAGSTSGDADQPVLTKSDDMLTESYALHDVAGTPSYSFLVHTERQFENLGWLGLNGAILRFVGMSVIFLAIITWLTGRLVTKPLTDMARKMSHITETGDLDHRLDVNRGDEIGWAADVFNKMMDELKSARGRVIEQSYTTGMADLAAGILNNVRQAVTPVADATRSATAVANKMENTNFVDACRELAFTKVEGERRQKLGTYIVAYADGTKARLADLKHQLDRIDVSTQHIQNILEDHESLSRWPRQVAPIDCRQLIEEAARGVSSTSDLPIEVDVSVSGALPHALGHGFILRQVVGNLLANSVDAIERAQRKFGRIHVLVRNAERAGEPAIEIVVGDNGAGFTSLQSDQLFDRGYSTRSDRPGGFGLYWCRAALTAMNASITGQSPGPGLGATFRVFLPLAKEAAGNDQPLESVA